MSGEEGTTGLLCLMCKQMPCLSGVLFLSTLSLFPSLFLYPFIASSFLSSTAFYYDATAAAAKAGGAAAAAVAVVPD